MALVRQPALLASVCTRTIRSITHIKSEPYHLCSSCFRSRHLIILPRCTRDLLQNIQTSFPSTFVVSRSYAKGKNKPKSTKSGHKHINLSKEEASEVLDIAKYREDLDKIVNELKNDYVQNMALRTNFASFDRLMVKTDDGTIPLNQIATITQKNPSFVMIDLARSRQYIGNVMETLQKSSMNLNPQQEKTHTIFVNVPKVSREHRENMAKGAKAKFQDAKDKMNKVYGKYVKVVNTYINNKGDRDLGENVKKMILQEMTEQVHKAEAMMKAKQNELLS